MAVAEAQKISTEMMNGYICVLQEKRMIVKPWSPHDCSKYHSPPCRAEEGTSEQRCGSPTSHREALAHETNFLRVVSLKVEFPEVPETFQSGSSTGRGGPGKLASPSSGD